jgi:hypothetical protein
MLTSYEALTPLRGGVSRCPTRVGIRHVSVSNMGRCPTRVGTRHLYDTRTTPIRIVKQVLPKK